MAVALALLSALLFGAMTVALRFALRSNPDAELGALVTTAIGFLVAAVAVALRAEGDSIGEPSGLALFALAGVIAPGGSNIFFARAVREAGPSRTSIVVGSAPLFAAAIAIALLGEPLEAPLAAGAVLIVLAGVALAGESDRPEHFRSVGVAFAFGSTLLFSTRDNLVRWYSEDTELASLPAAAAALAAGALAIGAFLALTRRRRLLQSLSSASLLPFAPAGILFGLSYVLLFEAYYRARVTVVSPLVATESLWGVSLSALLLGRSELIGGRLVLAALLVVSGGALISVFR